MACSYAAGLYLGIFVAGMQIDRINPQIGYRSLCREAMAEAELRGINRYVLATDAEGEPLLVRGENIDVFLGSMPEMLPAADIENSPESMIGDSNGIIVFTVKDKNPTFVVYGHE